MREWFEQYIGAEALTVSVWGRLAIIAGIILAAYFVDYVLIRRLIIPAVGKITSRTKTKVDDILLSDKVCRAACAIVPPVILTFALPFVLKGESAGLVVRFTMIYIVINVCRFMACVIGALHKLFVYKGNEKARSLKGLAQTFQVFVWLFGTIIIISILLDKSPIYLLGGIGAFATILLLIFQDSIKGLVAGVQLSLNDMLRVGDWIVMKDRNVDGVVTEITLTTVKVQNWDNTILTIQPYALLTDTFQNWKGMSESDGRRITRVIHINMNSIRICTPEEFAEWKQKGYLPADAKEGEATNLEAYRGFFTAYLLGNEKINTEMTLMVRQLEANYEGIPLQIYCFSRSKDWVIYEGVQAQLVEYMIATLNNFDLYAFQRGCGTDAILIKRL